MEYWKFYYSELRKRADGELDIKHMRTIESGSIKLNPGTYFISATGSFLYDWTGDKWQKTPDDKYDRIRDEINAGWENIDEKI
ncbi:MAG TPA: hypothetical protein ENH82_00310 [bacterium]|nr:hypothetical protein [bacterium]